MPHRGREPLAEALPGLVRLLMSLDGSLNPQVSSEELQRFAKRVASLAGRLVGALTTLPFADVDQRNKSWEEEVVGNPSLGLVRDFDLQLRLGLTEIQSNDAKTKLEKARTALRNPTTFAPAVIALKAAADSLKLVWKDEGSRQEFDEKLKDGEQAERSKTKKAAAEAQVTGKSGILPRKDEEAGQISVVEMNAVNYNTWELVLNDEPYSDCAATLLALTDRYLSRQELPAAEDALHEALLMLTKLETDESDHISPEDRWQVGPMLRRVQLRTAWLSQGRDAYGRFASQAPPRRLSALLGQFKRHLERYERFLSQAREQIERSDRARRTALLLDLQRNEANYAARHAQRQIEKCRRLIANTQTRISSHEMRHIELNAEMARGESQYRKGKARSDKAMDDIGNLALFANRHLRDGGRHKETSREGRTATQRRFVYRTGALQGRRRT